MSNGISLARVEEIINSSSSAYEVLYSICLLFSESVRDGEVTVGALGSVFAPGHARTGTTIDEEIVRITRLVEVQLERGKAEGFVRHGIDSALLAPAILGACVAGSVAQSALRSGDPDDADGQSVADSLMAFVCDGIKARA